MINVTKTYLPPFDEYAAILKKAWDKAWITNNGELVLTLEQKLKEYLGVEHLWFTANGTVVLQMALKALHITGEVITTPFSYVATTTAILWENCTPVFVDIRPDTFCIDEEQIEAAITEKTQAILATHVYGLPCAVEKIQAIADRHGLSVIYDGAHAFGALLNGKSLLHYGDISTCSFHATKVFQTVEGGSICCNDAALAEQLFLYRSFGHIGDDYYSIGINGKNSEFHAAMGLSLLPYMSQIINQRKSVFEQYNAFLQDKVQLLNVDIPDYKSNYAYYPVFFRNEAQALQVKQALHAIGVNTRRYFFPSLNQLPYLQGTAACPLSEDVSGRVLCLPLYPDLPSDDVARIAAAILKEVS